MGFRLSRRRSSKRLFEVAASAFSLFAACASIAACSVRGDEAPAGTEIVESFAGKVFDDGDRPLEGVVVRVHWIVDDGSEPRLIAERVTDAKGAFAFGKVAIPTRDYSVGSPIVTAKKTGYASSMLPYFASWRDDLGLRMSAAAKLSGRVVDPDGAPIAGAIVTDYLAYRPIGQPPPAVLHAVTDAEGRFAIDDVSPFDAKEEAIRSGTRDPLEFDLVRNARRVAAQHPDFAFGEFGYLAAPGEILIEMAPGATIEGRVVDRATDEPVPDLRVWAGSILSTKPGASRFPHARGVARTDADGRYRISGLPHGFYNVIADVDRERHAAAAIDSLLAEGGRTVQAPTIEQVEGGWLEGRILDAETREPLTHYETEDGEAEIGVVLHGPDRPQSGAAPLSVSIDADGRFRVRVTPGKQYLRLGYGKVKERLYPRERFEQGIDVAAGEVVQFDMLVLPETAAQYDGGEIVRRKVPVAEERELARIVRDLGGEYEVDDDGHVATVDLSKLENRDFDVFAEFFQALPSLSRLRALSLQGTQATDSRLSVVQELKSLEQLTLVEPWQLSAGGPRRLAELPRLREANVSYARLADDELAVLAGLPGIESLSVRGEAFTDAGIAHLAEARSLKHLRIESTAIGRVSGLSFASIGKLHGLETLELEGFWCRADQIPKLEGLTNLKRLSVDGADGEGAAETLLKLRALESLAIDADVTEAELRQIAELPNLKEARIESDKFSPRFLREFSTSSVFDLTDGNELFDAMRRFP